MVGGGINASCLDSDIRQYRTVSATITYVKLYARVDPNLIFTAPSCIFDVTVISSFFNNLLLISFSSISG